MAINKRSSPRSKRTSSRGPTLPPHFNVGCLRIQQCVGGPSVDPFHKKPFLGISDLAQLTFCEIQSTISQLVAQDGYVSAAAMDDFSEGIGSVTHDTRSVGGRARIAGTLAKLLASGELNWETRRLVGRLSESLELNGVSSERRHFELDDFYVIGCPDGISGDGVIEFAASRSPRLSARAKRIQANLYAVLWRVTSSRVIVVGTVTSERIDESGPADVVEAERWLGRAFVLLSGADVPRPPDSAGKCKRCRFAAGCPYPKERRIPTLAEMNMIARV